MNVKSVDPTTCAQILNWFPSFMEASQLGPVSPPLHETLPPFNRFQHNTARVKLCLRIIEEVAETYNVSVKWLKTGRLHSAVRVRDEALYRCRRESSLSYPKIAKLFGMDHTSVMDACKRHEARIA